MSRERRGVRVAVPVVARRPRVIVRGVYPHLDPWSLRIFCGSFVVLCATSVYLITQIGLTGDEPWYLLQGYSLAHFHSVDMAWVAHATSIYRQFIGSVPPDHLRDFRGNGVLVETYLPGYAAIVGVLYALGGRLLIICVQSLAGALVATLLFRETYRLWQSHAAALFATVAYCTCLPALMYVSQVFPSTLASLAAFVAFIVVVRVLPAARGRRVIVAGAMIGALAAALPWLHIKYAPIAIVVATAALLQLVARRTPRMRARWRWNAAGDGVGGNSATDAAPPIGELRDTGISGGRGSAWAAAGLIIGLPLASALLIILYSQRYFGTWYPQYRVQTNTTFVNPDLFHMIALYNQMFLGGQSGLIPWAPLMLLAPAGLVVLLVRSTREGVLALLWIAGLLSAFLSAAIAPHVSQAYALPARFTVECLPFFALCVASVFAIGWHTLRSRTLRVKFWAARDKSSLRFLVRGAPMVLCCLLLLGVDAWFCLVGLLDPSALYPSAIGIRLVTHHPHLLPGWWFALFGVRGL